LVRAPSAALPPKRATTVSRRAPPTADFNSLKVLKKRQLDRTVALRAAS